MEVIWSFVRSSWVNEFCICGLFDFSSRKDFEIDDIVKAIEQLTDAAKEAKADEEG